jgi:hypothetical protein
MNSNENLRLVVNLLTTRNQKNLSNFVLKLNKNERNNFMSAKSKPYWMKAWLRNKHGFTNAEINERVKKQGARNTFKRYINSLEKLKNTNMIIKKHMRPKTPPPFVKLQINNKGHIELEPVCATNHTKGVYIHYGITNPLYRGQKIGYRLRKVAVNAALNSKLPLYQVSQNIEKLVKQGNLPISGRIMKSLGAVQINYAPPCRAGNKRNKYNYAFVVGAAPFLKRPIKKLNT